MLRNGNRDTEFIPTKLKLQINYIIVLWQTDRQLFHYNRVLQKIQNETEEETEERREDAKQRVSQRVQNETEGETEPIIFYLYLIKFKTKNSPSHTFHNLPSFLTARIH